MNKENYLVSAIVSVYNCEGFISGCLEDIERQTIADRLEIVVVNSGSTQNEEAIIKDFQKRYDNIVYIRTESRETIYQAWNRGIKASSGKYITNANADDRHRKDAFEIMTKELEDNKNIDLVYADDIIIETENETFEKHTAVGYARRPEFDRYQLLSSSFIGPHPMWRKSIHKDFGYFDEDFEIAGDYEFWLRISEKCNFKHIKGYLGLYLNSLVSAGHKNPEVDTFETVKIGNKYFLKAGHNKKALQAIKKRQSEAMFDLGYYYFKKNFILSARAAFLGSLAYSWLNFKSYRGLIASCLSSRISQFFKK